MDLGVPFSRTKPEKSYGMPPNGWCKSFMAMSNPQTMDGMYVQRADLRKGFSEVVQQPPQRFDGLTKVRVDGIPGDIEHGRFQYL